MNYQVALEAEDQVLVHHDQHEVHHQKTEEPRDPKEDHDLIVNTVLLPPVELNQQLLEKGGAAKGGGFRWAEKVERAGEDERSRRGGDGDWEEDAKRNILQGDQNLLAKEKKGGEREKSQLESHSESHSLTI